MHKWIRNRVNTNSSNKILLLTGGYQITVTLKKQEDIPSFPVKLSSSIFHPRFDKRPPP